MNQVHTSSRSGTWDTPADLVSDLAPVFEWNLDVCASRSNVCENFYSPEQDGLSQQWNGLFWMNPEYGRKRRIDAWMHRARVQGEKPGTTGVCLPPVRTSTRWWQDNVPYANLVVFIRGRLVFGSDEWWQYLWDTPIIDGKPNVMYGRHGKKNSAPFPSAFVVFGDGLTGAQVAKLASYGSVMIPAKSLL